MTCPPAIADLLLAILAEGVLRCRSAGWAGDAARCAIEADHIHNLPSLIEEFSPEALHYYWEVERPAYLQQTTVAGISPATFEPFWQQLGVQLRNAAVA